MTCIVCEWGGKSVVETLQKNMMLEKKNEKAAPPPILQRQAWRCRNAHQPWESMSFHPQPHFSFRLLGYHVARFGIKKKKQARFIRFVNYCPAEYKASVNHLCKLLSINSNGSQLAERGLIYNLALTAAGYIAQRAAAVLEQFWDTFIILYWRRA